ncbi:hypothetical protein P5F14_02105 [Clostridium perfringens]|nr:hypothetical protein [Clostridium perfringens]MDK0754273.1 hypothetical protein [Clostridium perfringens]MDK0757447.1 hypothetical protein [Clostridium perfringens]MDK0941391.1 hypothetical protein [Clostridium perfringens]
MWSKKTHQIANYISLLLVSGLSLLTIIYLLDLGLMGKLLTLVIVSIFIRIIYFYLMQKLKVWLKPKKKVKEQHITKVKAEPSLDMQQQFLIDLKCQASQLFKVAIQSQKLNRAEIISIKYYLKNNIDDSTLKNKKYSNEAHCIYSYLKSEYIDENTLNCVIKNIFIFANRKTA